MAILVAGYTARTTKVVTTNPTLRFVVATLVAGYAAKTTKVVTTNSITGIAGRLE